MGGYIGSSDGSAPFPGMKGVVSAISDPLGIYKALFPAPEYSYDPQSTSLANLSMQQWQAASQMLYPNAQRLVSMAEDPNYISNARNQAGVDASGQLANLQSARSRFLALQGIQPTGAQAMELQRQDKIQGAASQVGAMNTAGDLARQTQMQILAGTSGGGG